MKYDKDFEPMAWKPVRRSAFYIAAFEHALHFLSEAFFIEDLADNKLPIDGKEYITVDKDADTMTIRSIFNKYNDYMIPRLSMVNLNDKLITIYEKEITYLKDTFNRIGGVYIQPVFGEDYEISLGVDDGLFNIIVEGKDPAVPGRPLWRTCKTTLGLLSEKNIIKVAREVFRCIRDELVKSINKNRAKFMSGGDFDGDVLYKEYLDKEMAKLQLNGMYGLYGGDILANGELTKRIEDLRAAIYKEFGVSESIVDIKESIAAYEHAMDAISSTFDKYRGGYMRDYTSMYGKAIKKVIFNDPATVVMWNDGTKTVVKKHGDVEFNGEAAVMYAYVLRWHFNNNRKSMRIWLKQNAKRFEWQSEEPKKITVTRTSKGKITKASQKEIYEAMTPEQKEVVDAMIQDAVKESKKTNKVIKKAADGGKNEDTK